MSEPSNSASARNIAASELLWVRRAFYVAIVVFIAPGILDIWFEEPYPAPIGPHFEHVPDNGKEWLVERPKSFVELSDGTRKKFRFRRLGIKQRAHWVAQSWIRHQKFQSAESRAWLSKKIRARSEYEDAQTLVVQWRITRVNKRTRKRRKSYVKQELRIPL